MFDNITGLILSGGKSTRMGENKSFLKINGRAVIEHTAELMKSVFKEVILSTNHPEEYEFLNLPMVKDQYLHKGPLAGIHAGLSAATNDKVFVISCDIPLITKEVIEFISNFNSDKKIVACKADGFIQQLAGIYSKDLLPLIEEKLKDEEVENRDSVQAKRKCKVHSLLNEVGAEIIDEKDIPGYKNNMFLNMNRKEDYNIILKLLESNSN